MIAGDVIRRARGDKWNGGEKEEMSRVTIKGDRAQLPGWDEGGKPFGSIFLPASGAPSADTFDSKQVTSLGKSLESSGLFWRLSGNDGRDRGKEPYLYQLRAKTKNGGGSVGERGHG